MTLDEENDQLKHDIAERRRELYQLNFDLQITKDLVWKAEVERRLFKSLQTAVERLFEGVDSFILHSGQVEMSLYYTQLFGKQLHVHRYAQRLREVADKLEGVVPITEWSGQREVSADPPQLYGAGQE